ncbi:hypothetical protein HYV73_02180 [Candidatus Uhrbacteria bacterium]|nr:hypothetical protein [Candidatus Uhrbacteria bacterium]
MLKQGSLFRLPVFIAVVFACAEDPVYLPDHDAGLEDAPSSGRDAGTVFLDLGVRDIGTFDASSIPGALIFVSPVLFTDGRILFYPKDSAADAREALLDTAVSGEASFVYVLRGVDQESTYCFRWDGPRNYWRTLLDACPTERIDVWNAAVPGVFGPVFLKECINRTTGQSVLLEVREQGRFDPVSDRLVDRMVLIGLPVGEPVVTGLDFFEDRRYRGEFFVEGAFSYDRRTITGAQISAEGYLTDFVLDCPP